MFTKFKTLALFLALSLAWGLPADASTKYVNSVTQETLTIASSATTASTTVAAPTGTYFMLWQGNTTTATTSQAQSLCYATLSGTTLTATRATASTNTCILNVTLVDATSSLVTSVQSGTVTLTSNSQTQGITSVTTANSAVSLLGYSSTVTTFNFSENTPTLTLTSPTVLTANLDNRSGTIIAAWQVINFNPSALNQSTQPFSANWANSSISTTLTVTSVNVNNSMIFFAGSRNGANETAGYEQQTAQLTSATQITVTAGATAGDTGLIYNGTLVEFVTGVFTQNAQRGTVAIAAGTSNTGTITSAATAATSAYITGYRTPTTATTSYAAILPRMTQTSATVLTETLGATGSATVAYEAVTWSETGSVPAVQCVPTGNHQIGLIQPTYVTPPDVMFSGLITLMGSNPHVPVTVIINPASGPGTSAQAVYTTVISQLQAAGATVLGYVPTGNGVANTDYPGQNEATIEAMVASWVSFYPAIQGIFYDEMDDTGSSTACTSISGGNCITLYQQLTTYAHGQALPIVYGNPGDNTVSAYFSASPPTADKIMVYEDNAYGTSSLLNNSGLCGLNGYNCAAIAYAVSFSAPNFLLMEQNDGFVFMTDASAANPYIVAPTYLSTEMSNLNTYNTGGGTSCPMVQGFP